MMRRMRPMLLMLLGVAGRAPCLADAAQGGRDRRNAAPPARVAVAQARLETPARARAGVGTFGAVRQVTLAPEVGGRITTILFEPGKAAKAGD